MNRQRVLQIILLLLGLLFTAAIYPLFLFWRQEPPLAMMLSLYVPLGIFLLVALRNPSEHRSVIMYAGWANIAHGTLMGVQGSHNVIPHRELVGSAVLVAIGIALLALAPKKQIAERVTSAAA